MTTRRLAAWLVAGLFLFAVLLSGLALRELADASRCSTGEFDTVRVERLGREWLPPRVLCEVTLEDGSTHTASVNYWPAFALLALSGSAAVAIALQARRERRDRPEDRDPTGVR